MGVLLDAGEVRQATAAKMAYRLKQSGFAVGGGGQEVADFTEQTRPTLSKATEVTTRIAALVSNDFPGADGEDKPELVTIASLRSAIELEASVDNMDPERIRVWRDLLREYVGRFADSGSGAGEGEDPGAAVLEAVWSFGPTAPPRAAGAEVPWEPVPMDAAGAERPRRLRW